MEVGKELQMTTEAASKNEEKKKIGNKFVKLSLWSYRMKIWWKTNDSATK